MTKTMTMTMTMTMPMTIDEFPKNLYADGYVDVNVILRHRNFRGVTEAEVRSVVDQNEKQRFALRTEEKTNKLQIKANQGHTLQVGSRVQSIRDTPYK